MKTIVAAFLASAFLAAGVYAESPASQADAVDSSAGVANAQSHRNKDVEKHIADLHAKLKITPAQESEWGGVEKTMLANASEIEAAIDKREVHGTAVDDLNAYAEVTQAHADGIKRLATAFSSLYAVLSEEQKRLADKAFVRHEHDHSHVH